MPVLISHVAASLRRAGCHRVLAAFSGGMDSCVLASVLAEVCPTDARSFELAYFNHRLRGEESDQEERFCRGFAEKLGVPLHVGFWSEPRSSEAEARLARYRWLLEVAESGGFDGVATAHHRRDQAETVLIRLVRGSGLRGLRAMAERSPLAGSRSVLLLRPMLDVPRRALQEFAERRGLEWFEDSSNRSDRFLRNRIRRQLLPLLEELRPGAERRLASLAKAARAESSALDHAARRAAKRLESGDGWAFLPRKAWIRLPGLARRLILRAVHGMHSAAPQTPEPGANIARRLPRPELPSEPRPGTLRRLLDSMLDSRSHQRRFALTDAIDAVVLSTGVMLLDRARWPASGFGLPETLRVGDPEVERLLDVRISWPEPLRDALRAPVREENLLPPPRGLWVKTREPGERLGRAGPALKRLFIDRKVPRFMRDRYPIIGDEDGPLLVPGLWRRPGNAVPHVSFGPSWPQPLLPPGLNQHAPKTVEP